MKNSKSHGKQEVDVQQTWKGETRYKSPCQSHISNIKSFLPVEAETSVTKVFITAIMKNSKSRGKQEVDVRQAWKGEIWYKSLCQSHISNIK